MIVNKKPKNPIYFRASFLVVMLIIFPFVYYGLNLMEYGGDYHQAWQDFLGKTPNWTSRGGRPRFVMPGIHASLIVYGSLICLLPLWGLRLLKGVKYPAHGVLVRDLSLFGTDAGTVKVQMINGKIRRMDPYVEVFFDSEYVGGLVGNESIVIKTSPGAHVLHLSLAYPYDKSVLTELSKTQKTPLEKQLDPVARSAHGVDYGYKCDIPFQVEDNSTEVIEVKLLNRKNPAYKEDKTLPIIQAYLQCWKPQQN